MSAASLPTVELRVIAVYDSAGVWEFRGDQLLEAPGVLPGFQAAVGSFFE